MYRNGFQFNHDKYHGPAAKAHLLDATANLMREQRLAAKQDHLHAVGKAAAKLENGRTQDALGKLGAGKNYGQN